ncbi:DNA-binding transcriptional LysR family regulator [Streptomyces griseochromogenes]|uniref:DNA-binding transcriptional LysR family regulator n=1 Tax=Streptomyces griseochromogenes TaxID=68214 RepID=A0A1B1B1B4_9ACTN|nr:LysR family transcriptional regulator [Streptomyces griseochromogenes]ANP52604.1 LysR family transcriptional regulator [Streptomyces griseochromogenes]MBP2047183.1 DNA-binding transcriptional LysR family regulator [Streptomyces griseochromogenes]
MDIDTRLLRSFLAVAEEGSLTRAAEHVFVSQPALTKQIRQLESLLGVQLFDRSRAGMALTGPGRELAHLAPKVLEAWNDALRATRAADREAGRVLRVGFIASAANEATQEIVAAFARRRPGWRAELRQAAWTNPSAGLATGDVDVALLRLPFPGQDALRVEPLFSEPRWVALPGGHPLAGRDTIAFRDLWDEPFVAAPPQTGAWREYWLATDEREDHPVRIGAVTEQPDDWLSAIANGYGIALAPRSAARFYARPGVVYRPVTGVSPTRVGVAWAAADDRNPVVRDFVRCCLDLARPE